MSVSIRLGESLVFARFKIDAPQKLTCGDGAAMTGIVIKITNRDLREITDSLPNNGSDTTALRARFTRVLKETHAALVVENWAP